MKKITKNMNKRKEQEDHLPFIKTNNPFIIYCVTYVYITFTTK